MRRVASASADALHAADDFVAALRVFAAELRNQRIGALPVKFFKRLARVDGHAPGHHRHGRNDRDHKERHQLGAEAHGLPSPPAAGAANQTSSRFQPPQRGAIQSRTCGLRP